MRKIDTAKGPAKLTDEHGLYLRVSPRGAKSWIQRLNIQGLRTDNAIGHYPSMGLAEARVVGLRALEESRRQAATRAKEDGKGGSWDRRSLKRPRR